MSEQSPTRSDHSADNAAGVGNGFGRSSIANMIIRNSSSNNNNLMNDTFVGASTPTDHDVREDWDKDSTALPSTWSFFLDQRFVSLSAAPPSTMSSLSRGAPTASIDIGFSNEDGTSDVSGTIPRKVSFDESEVESSMSPPGKERNLEEKLSSLLQRQQRRSRLQCKISAIDKDDDGDMMMI